MEIKKNRRDRSQANLNTAAGYRFCFPPDGWSRNRRGAETGSAGLRASVSPRGAVLAQLKSNRGRAARHGLDGNIAWCERDQGCDTSPIPAPSAAAASPPAAAPASLRAAGLQPIPRLPSPPGHKPSHLSLLSFLVLLGALSV